jgi:hypothetical protein
MDEEITSVSSYGEEIGELDPNVYNDQDGDDSEELNGEEQSENENESNENDNSNGDSEMGDIGSLDDLEESEDQEGVRLRPEND